MTNNTDSPPGFKQLTPKNWLEHDTTGSHIVTVSPTGMISKPTSDDWATMILTPRLSEDAPRDLVELFEVARGALCYGFFFYPLYTLGSEQLYRVLEAAVASKFKSEKAPARVRRLRNRIDWLRDYGKIDQETTDRLHAARELRNISSHADRQSIYDQTAAIRGVGIVVELINQLFDGSGSEKSGANS